MALERPDVMTRLVLHASVGVLGRRPWIIWPTRSV